MNTDEHRRAQLALRSVTLRDLLRLWRGFDVNQIAKTWPALETALVLLIQARGDVSSGLAVAYYQANRIAAGATGSSTPRLAPTPTPDEIVSGLRVVGPVNAGRQLARGREVADVATTTLVNLSGEVTRQVLNVGRATLVASSAADRATRGVRRTTDRDPCRWCADQASRTYPPTERFPAHAHCACFPEPVY